MQQGGTREEGMTRGGGRSRSAALPGGMECIWMDVRRRRSLAVLLGGEVGVEEFGDGVGDGGVGKGAAELGRDGGDVDTAFLHFGKILGRPREDFDFF
eukprot:CAMPEP_0197426336 /NCGR_PEP_ID=MMETSP1170-20131217/34499_1 /TAXON_ID=54406 /ORGANISM="Sarcinochrysis sp, Strain CCMP770" /LENGTH=97 /DNA_ID=CAMNT_0042953965 /DNA_START=173 /DNA_END=464 /DNA_ORIENTATION=-